MTGYWLKILLRALGIFALGMLIVVAVRRGRATVHDIRDGSGPLTIPVGFFPLKVDGERVGTIRTVTIYRSAPRDPTAVGLSVSLVDSVSPERLADCILVVNDLQRLDERTSFDCAHSADTAGRQLASLGTIHVRDGGASFPIFAPAAELERIRRDLHDSGPARGERLQAAADSARDAAMERVDSIREAAQSRADSIRDAAQARADSIRESAQARADSIRHVADSLAEAGRSAIPR